MREIDFSRFQQILFEKKYHYPLNGQAELTYRCNLNCIHCYCKGCENKKRELSTLEWKKIFHEIKKAGCIYLTLTGGEPLMRDDFLELYTFVKKEGFIVTIFTNGQKLTDNVLDYLVKYPPFSIEITLNGITASTFEAITQVKGAFSLVMENIEKIKEKKLPLILKANCLKQNKNEIIKIKSFADKILGREKGKNHFKYSALISPRLNCDATPLNFRLSFKELLEIRKSDTNIWEEYQNSCRVSLPGLKRDKNFLYHCSSWLDTFYIDPYGRLKLCPFLNKFSVDLKTSLFKNGFYKVFPRVLNERFQSGSKCKACSLRLFCLRCPGRAYLETGNEEAPVSYFCSWAKETKKIAQKSKAK